MSMPIRYSNRSHPDEDCLYYESNDEATLARGASDIAGSNDMKSYNTLQEPAQLSSRRNSEESNEQTLCRNCHWNQICDDADVPHLHMETFIKTPPKLRTDSIPSLGADTDVSMHGTSVTHFLCIPVTSEGRQIASEAFLTPKPPAQDRSASNSYERINPIAPTYPARVTWAQPNSTPISSQTHPTLDQFGGQYNETPNATTSVREPLVSNYAPGTSSRLSRLSEMAKCDYGISSLKHETSAVRRGAVLETEIPPSAQSQQSQLSFSSGQTIMPLKPVAFDCSLNKDEITVDKPSGQPRIVLASNGTPVAFTGDYMEVLLKGKWMRWGEAEDEILLSAIEEEEKPPNWKRISRKYFQGLRTHRQCKDRYNKTLRPGLIKGSWKVSEEKIIQDGMQNGLTYREITNNLPGRIVQDVKDRWVNFLDPSVMKSPWTEEETKLLFEAQAQQGNKWTKIAQLMPGRSASDVKNRWHNTKISLRRKTNNHLRHTENSRRLGLLRVKGEHAI